MSNQERFYHCKKCNKAVPTSKGMCDSCRRRFINDKTYTREQIEAIIREREGDIESESSNAPNNSNGSKEVMECIKCGKTFDKSHTFCDDCKLPLRMKIEQEKREGRGTAVVFEEEEERKEYFGMNYGQIIDNPLYEMEISRYINGVEEKGESIPVCRTKVPIGRRVVCENNIFPGNIDDVEDTILRVSRDNAFLYQEDGKLFIEYDTINHTSSNSRKSPITINGVPLSLDEKRAVEAGAVIICGDAGQRNLSGCIKIQIHALRNNDFASFVEQKVLENQNRKGSGYTKDIKQLKEYLASLQEENAKLWERVEENTKSIQQIEDLDLSSLKSTSELFESLEGMFANMANSKSDEINLEQCLDIFLKDCSFKDELLKALNEAQLDLLKRAAFLEYNIANQTGMEPDYAPALLYLGKLMENYAYHRLLPMVRDYNQVQWEKLVDVSKVPMKNGQLKNPDNAGFLVLSDMTKPFVYKDDATNDIKYRNKVIVAIAKAYTHKNFVQPAEIAKVGQAFIDFDIARGYRNESAHVKLEATLASDLEYVSKEDFEIAKKDILGTDFLVKINKYYRGIYGNKEVM